MARTDTLGNFLTDVANAIRTKKGTSETILARDFDTEIENLPSGGDYNAKVDTSKNYTTGSVGGIKSLITEIRNIDTSLITNMSYMFANCSNLTTIPQLNTSNATNMQSMFTGCTELATTLQLDASKATNMQHMFNACRGLTSVVFDNATICTPTNVIGMFLSCIRLTHIDLRSFDFSNATNYTGMFGYSASDGVPDNCEIIVADDTQKTWITDKFTRLTNVKTVAEYEAEQNA